jgi:hypothetical protein
MRSVYFIRSGNNLNGQRVPCLKSTQHTLINRVMAILIFLGHMHAIDGPDSELPPHLLIKCWKASSRKTDRRTHGSGHPAGTRPANSVLEDRDARDFPAQA